MPPTFDERAEWFAAHYTTTRGRIRLALVLERLLETLPEPPARILDAGGGPGAVAIPLAEQGYRVTLLDPSEGMLSVARDRIEAAGVDLKTIRGGIEDVRSLAPGPYDIVCCHAVLMYVDDPEAFLRVLRSVVERGAVLSMLERNRDALAMRPGLKGDYEEARRVLDGPESAGKLGLGNRGRTVEGWCRLLRNAGWQTESWVGVRLFSDLADENLPPERFEQLLSLEREAGRSDSYRPVARLVHMSATAI